MSSGINKEPGYENEIKQGGKKNNKNEEFNMCVTFIWCDTSILLNTVQPHENLLK